MGEKSAKLTIVYYYDKEHNKLKTIEGNRSVLKGDLIRATGMSDSEAEYISSLVFEELSKLKYVTLV